MGCGSRWRPRGSSSGSCQNTEPPISRPCSIVPFRFISRSGPYAKARSHQHAHLAGGSIHLNPLETPDTARPDRLVILVAEDEAIIGFELADSLRLEGFEVAGPFDTCANAETWLKAAEQRVQGAILDNSLRDGPCTTLARDLRRQGIPFVVYSGHSRSHEASSEFGDAPWVVKPVPFEMLLK